MTRKIFILSLLAAFASVLLSACGGAVKPASEQGNTGAIAELDRAIDTSVQQVENATALAVDGSGNIYLSDSSAKTPRILKFDNSGKFVKAWGEPGSQPGQFTFVPPTAGQGPNGGFVAVDAQGNVYVSDAYNFRVQKFDPDGKFVFQFGSAGEADGQFDGPCAGPVTVDGQGNIYVSTFGRVQKFDSQGKFLAAHGSLGSENGQFMGAAFGSIDKQGNFYVADLLNIRVQKFDPDWKFLQTWGAAGTGPGQFINPVSLAVDQYDRLYAADNSNRIQVFSLKGEFVGQVSDTGKGNLPLTQTSTLVIDAKGKLYVADSGFLDATGAPRSTNRILIYNILH